MTKPTLSDFISTPDAAVKKGFRPTFLYIGYLLFRTIINLKDSFLYIFEPILHEGYLSILAEFVLNLLRVLFRFFMTILVFYIGLPFTWIYLFFDYKRYGKKLDGEDE